MTEEKARPPTDSEERRALREARSVIDRDRTGLAAGLNEVKKIAAGYAWIADGEWGSYDYTQRTETTLRKEVRWCLLAVRKAADDALNASGKLAGEACRAIDATLRAALGEARGTASASESRLQEEMKRAAAMMPELRAGALVAEVAALKAENTRLLQEARRWYLADGSYIELDPAEVIARRKAAAAALALNTPLRERLALVEPVVEFARDFERALLGDEDGGVREWIAECGAGSLLDEWHAALDALHALEKQPAVTGTPSDSSAFRPLGRCGTWRHGAVEDLPHPQRETCHGWTAIPAGGPEQSRGAAAIRPAHDPASCPDCGGDAGPLKGDR